MEGLSEKVVPEELGLGSTVSVGGHKTSGREELSSERSKSFIMELLEAREAEEPGVLLGPSGSPRLESRRSTQRLRLVLVEVPL